MSPLFRYAREDCVFKENSRRAWRNRDCRASQLSEGRALTRALGAGWAWRAVFICLPAFCCRRGKAFCCRRGKWPLSAELGRSFLWPFPPPRPVSSRSQACTSGAVLPQEGRAAAPRLFLFLWRRRLGAARCWWGGCSLGGAEARAQALVSPN